MKIRIWDQPTGHLVGFVEHRGLIDIIWFEPDFVTQLDEDKEIACHFTVSIKAEYKGPYLPTHLYVGIPSLHYCHGEEEETDETG